MKDKEYYIQAISKTLEKCNSDTIKAVYSVILKMTKGK